MAIKQLRNFFKLEASSGIALCIATLAALVLANSPWHLLYVSAFNTPIIFSFSNHELKISLATAINEGLMALFFLLVSVEIKRELISGELNTRAKAILPLIAASGGVILPALIFIACSYTHPEYLRGWAIPTATDIAFSLGIVALLGSRVPVGLKVFLTALAILDDLFAIIFITLFYTDYLAILYLSFAVICLLLLLLCNYMQIKQNWLYGIIGLLLWFCVLKSGIHATIAGVAVGLALPLQTKMEKNLHSWVAFLILPLFALANAGITFTDIKFPTLINPLVLGIILGLFVGKQIGIMLASWLAIKFGIARLPSRTNWRQFYGVAILCGIGFTMSLFIGALAFPGDIIASANEFVRVGVFVGSLLSGIMGYLILRMDKKTLGKH